MSRLEEEEKKILRGTLETQARILSLRPHLPNGSDAVADILRKELLRANRVGLVLSPPYAISRTLVVAVESGEQGAHRRQAVVGGPKDFNRLLSAADPQTRIVRDDGAVIHFTLTVSESAEGATLLAYDFELYDPSRKQPFIRFDLNPPAHANEDRGFRSHVHPGDDDLLVPSPLLAPLELLRFLIYDYRPRRTRARLETPVLES